MYILYGLKSGSRGKIQFKVCFGVDIVACAYIAGSGLIKIRPKNSNLETF